jgi:hypothetical protein
MSEDSNQMLQGLRLMSVPLTAAAPLAVEPVTPPMLAGPAPLWSIAFMDVPLITPAPVADAVCPGRPSVFRTSNAGFTT